MFKAFDSKIYLKNQEKAFKKVLNNKCEKLYIEIGGKLIQDKHSARVLPGYKENFKLNFIKKLFKNDFELVFVIASKDIINSRIRGDFKINYEDETIRTLNELEKFGTYVKNIVITMVPNIENSKLPTILLNFKQRLENIGKNVFLLKYKEHYSPCQDFIKELNQDEMLLLNNKTIVITGPGGGSGKFAFCISQLFNAMKNGITPMYLKLETFPVHDLSINHPLNLAYISSTADLLDEIIEDKRHAGSTSYNRDANNYELLNYIANEFAKEGRCLKTINSATEMGINYIATGIIDEEEIIKESYAEIARRYSRYKYEFNKNRENENTLKQAKKIMQMLIDDKIF